MLKKVAPLTFKAEVHSGNDSWLGEKGTDFRNLATVNISRDTCARSDCGDITGLTEAVCTTLRLSCDTCRDFDLFRFGSSWNSS